MIASIHRFITASWQMTVILLASIVYLIGLLFFRNDQLHPSLTSSELSTLTQSGTLHNILYFPVNAPYRLVDFLIVHSSKTHHLIDTFYLRSFSVVIGFLTVMAFFFLLRKRYNKYIAFAGTLLFASSTWFLNITRLASPEILLCGTVILIWCSQYLQNAKHDRIATLVSLVVACSFVYVPGFIWIILFGLVWKRKFISNLLNNISIWLRLFVVILAVALITPLIWGVIHSPTQLLTITGLPLHLSQPFFYLRSLLEVPINLFFRGPGNPAIWLGRLPLFDVACSVMFLLGGYILWKQRKLEYSRMLLGLIIVGWILVASGGPVSLSILIPLIYLVSVAGFAELLQQWQEVFPRNPVARSVGLGLISLVVISSFYYQTSRYFIAWPNNPMAKTSNTQNFD